MVEEDLGQATIVYDHPDEGTAEETVDNEHLAYVQDHWIVKTGENEAGHDTVRRIPAQRVYYVERDIEEFEREVRTVIDEVQSLADEFDEELRTLRREIGDALPGSILGGGRRERGETEPQTIEIESEDRDEE